MIETFAESLDVLAEIERLAVPRARSRRDFSAYAHRPADFIQDVLHVKTLWEKQREILALLETHDRVCVSGAVNVGKDYLADAAAMHACYAKGMLVLLTSASLRQVISISMRDVARFKASGRLPGELMKQSLAAPGTGGIIGCTSDSGSKLSGQHWPQGVFIVVSEAQAFDNEEQLAGLLSCASSAGCKVLAVGNPLLNSGWFSRIAQPDSGWATVTISAFDHPNVIEGREVIPGAINQRYIDDTAADFGVTSRIYQSRVLGKFPSVSTSNAIFTRAMLDRAEERWRNAA